VARVVEGHEIRRGAVTADGQGEAVLGLGFMLMGENSHEVTGALKPPSWGGEQDAAARHRVRPGLRAHRLVDKVLTPCATTSSRARCWSSPCCSPFLGSLRAGLIVALAIPLSMLFAFDLMPASASPAA
jgi:cobalt-zinc-cadmium resistance protein CzcA